MLLTITDLQSIPDDYYDHHLCLPAVAGPLSLEERRAQQAAAYHAKMEAREREEVSLQ